MKNTSRAYDKFYTILNRNDKEVDDLYRSYCLKRGISNVALWIYYAVYTADEPMTQADLCECWFLSRQTINSSLKTLEKTGEIILMPIPNNQKSKFVAFTELGMERAMQIMEPLLEAENKMLAEFSENELATLLALQNKRRDYLRKYLEEAK